MSNTEAVVKATKNCLSRARIGTYEAATGSSQDTDSRALALYAWNAKVSAALLAPLHVCEVTIRNAVADALDAVYGPHWPWEATFLISLPDSSGNSYNPRRDLRNVAARQPTTGKVIPELKFVFWQEMFTTRHDVRIWSPHLTRIFPHHDPTATWVSLRRSIYSDLEVIRRLRNRIAHHEPIFTRNLLDDFERIVKLIENRSPLVASWLAANQDASRYISQPPVFRGGQLWTPSHNEIALLAYRIWCEEGRLNGAADANWEKAKRILGPFSQLPKRA
jgi:hypothetical protein